MLVVALDRSADLRDPEIRRQQLAQRAIDGEQRRAQRDAPFVFGRGLGERGVAARRRLRADERRGLLVDRLALLRLALRRRRLHHRVVAQALRDHGVDAEVDGGERARRDEERSATEQLPALQQPRGKHVEPVEAALRRREREAERDRRLEALLLERGALLRGQRAEVERLERIEELRLPSRRRLEVLGQAEQARAAAAEEEALDAQLRKLQLALRERGRRLQQRHELPGRAEQRVRDLLLLRGAELPSRRRREVGEVALHVFRLRVVDAEAVAQRGREHRAAGGEIAREREIGAEHDRHVGVLGADAREQHAVGGDRPELQERVVERDRVGRERADRRARALQRGRRRLQRLVARERD